MGCSSTNYPNTDSRLNSGAEPVPGGQSIRGPYLVVSNHPETLAGANGWWPYSEATFAVPGVIDVNPEATTPIAVWCPIEEVRSSEDPTVKITPPELGSTTFGHREFDQWGWPIPGEPEEDPHFLGGNVGLYAAIVKYSFVVSNSDSSYERDAYLEIYGRNLGNGRVLGAAQIVQPTGYPEWVVPPLEWNSSNNPPNAAGCKLTRKQSGSAPVKVPASTTSQTIIVAFSAAGASALPGNLLLKKFGALPP